MPRYGVETKLNAEEAIQAAKDYFGEGGVGLEGEDQGPCCAYFEGGGGFVRVTVNETGDKTDVDIETREWDRQVKQFMAKIG